MPINFDLVSDLYLTTLEDFSWEGKATSLFCIVAGNISADHDVLFAFLETLEGDLEHDLFEGDFDRSYSSIRDNLEAMERVFFLHENIVILPNATLLATNGWTTFDFTSKHTIDETLDFLEQREMVPIDVANNIFKLAVTDQHYMYNSIESVQDMDEVTNVILVTNSVPCPDFVKHNFDYDGTLLGDTCGTGGIRDCLDNDIKNKVNTWLFGKYPDAIEHDVDGVRYISNPGAHRDLDIYYPKIIKP